MSRFLLEIGSEEIPARMQAAAAAQLAKRFTEACAAAGLAHGHVSADATPRRLWLIADSLADASAATSEERRGPRADAPDAALQGFLRSTGMARDQLEERDTGKGVFLFAVIKREGRSAADILAEIVPAIITAFDWPKSMRWGSASASTASPRWVRPLTHIVALLGDAVVPATVHGITTGRTSRGHRIHAPGPLEIISADTYAAQLRAAYVYVSSFVRRTLIANRAAALAEAAGLTVIPDEGLEIENAGLTEWPVPLLGHFDPAFLAVPREVIQLTMRTNQKYFSLADAEGALAPAFICVANMDANDGGTAVVAGNERVLSARLSDAKFFWDQDLAVVKAGGLEAFLPKLKDIVFHEKLGTVADKVERVAKLARWLVDSGAVPSSSPPLMEGPGEVPQASGVAELAERAARLCKADLVSATVGEFPEVQGIAGRYLAVANGESKALANAISEHYKPTGQGDDAPLAPLSVAVALADKLDTITAFFMIGEPPTGSKDPFALRRAALGVIAIILANGLRFRMERVLLAAAGEDLAKFERVFEGNLEKAVAAFFADRLKVQQREAGVRPDIIDAVFALGGEDDLVRLLARVRALQAFIIGEDGTNLLAGYKRAANILKAEDAKDGPHTASALDAATLSAPAEQALAQALDAALPTAAAAVAAEDFTAAMAALASLRGPVDAFFTDLMVNAPEPVVRANRLALLARFRDAVHTVADFSRIEG
ncbi:glycine--tRNA ligase beta subunit [Polymorphobacter multimanifer]|uniref:Glycine--tRNA ligase beta subunit n=1 Tax=Polymorphobacter multimanifer TaxID=1070431 RepID=A0A841L1G4_9SPHN|nr:glycine--tRNA ligase subunit beta [Polymorphobacter multimanifer]MBB6226669.1 glycyl-tRNA synthetase beta chain [Polymorphobacter multimanifer]GGI69316.1 glycine--tRNA ligase beta subunit [Polymorphobacter multimanifer]